MRPLASLQARLLALVLGLAAAVWLATAALTWSDVHHELDEMFDAHLAQTAALLLSQAHDADEDDEVDLPALHRYAPRVAIQVWLDDTLWVRSAQAPREPLGGPRFTPGFSDQAFDGTHWRVFSTEGEVPGLRVYVAEQDDSRRDILWALLRGMLWPVLLALPLMAAGLWWAVRRGLTPLRDMRAAIAARDPRALQPLVLPGTALPSEMAPMLLALNRLFERIAQLMDAERRFTADAAHELRTPIAAIRTQAQVALGAQEEGPRRHALQAVLQGCERATRLVEQLLTLSRLEAEGAPALQPVALDELAREVLADLAPAALDQGQELELDAAPGCRVRAEPTLAAVLLRNLVDNAIRYSPPGARVQVTLARGKGGGARLCVEDSGPGLDEAQRARLGERFFRVLGSGASGSGLGWSIVRRIAAAHGAQVEVARSETLGGLRVRVDWPA
ncbi:ATP-binding protein [Azohydromonas caseinilytica]|uniref:histidine kinase n=1 Tax=Azohydromonas caseinilytica TaxID=2728836 RepID=A0A848FBU8_9BURK|nr:ATP-binding protein [Azohydromonas caseinilytica]NML15909.1 two-component sensor histidine kinase [Azohydromonas caseinilytica]